MARFGLKDQDQAGENRTVKFPEKDVRIAPIDHVSQNAVFGGLLTKKKTHEVKPLLNCALLASLLIEGQCFLQKYLLLVNYMMFLGK